MPNSILSLPAPRARLVVLGLAVALATSGCAQLKGRQGYVVDPLLTEAITPGVDNRRIGGKDARPPDLRRPVQRQ